MRGGVPHGAAGESHKSGSSQLGPPDAAGGASTRPPPPPPVPPSRDKKTSTPLSSAVGPVEELCDVYKKLTPELRERRFVRDIGDFLGLSGSF